MKHALRTALTCLLLVPAALVIAQDCFYTLRMFAADGNGWGGSYVTVCIGNAGAFDCNDYTLEAGEVSEVLIPANIGQVITVTYYAMGGDQNAILYQILMFGGGLFHSNSPPAEGVAFAQSTDCQPPPAPQTDRIGSFWMDMTLNHAPWAQDPAFSGYVIDLDADNQGCLTNGENQGLWYELSPFPMWGGPPFQGPYAFSITAHPDHPADYDFALWGPYPTLICPPPDPPIRCSFASTQGSTGLSALATDDYDADEDGWASPIVVDGSGIYLLYVGRKDLGAVNFTFSPNFPTALPAHSPSGTFALHPNPAQDRTTITLRNVVDGTVFLDLHDAAGRRVLQQQLPSATGGSTIDLDLHAVQPGAYVVHLRDIHGMPMGSARLLKQ